MKNIITMTLKLMIYLSSNGYGEVLKIKFPSDPPKPLKEDWELIVDSWYD
ncbi:hypothetical protein ACGTJS_07060 [Faucicola mancuniensis]|nr:hypothetical protein [uncultured Moraxella sp.]